MDELIVDGTVLKVPPDSKGISNGFMAADCLEENRRTKIDERGKTVNDAAWMMRILPYIAEWFDADRHDVLEWWAQVHGAKAVFGKERTLL